MIDSRTQIRFGSVLGTLAMCFSHGAFAQVIIEHEPVASIPTLSSAMMVVMALLLAVMAFRMLKARPGHSGRLLTALLTVGAFALTAGGVRMVGDAQAIPCGPNMENPAGGLVCASIGNSILNQSGVTQRITGVYCGSQILSNGISAQISGPVCVVGSLVNPGALCVAEEPPGGCALN